MHCSGFIKCSLHICSLVLKKIRNLKRAKKESRQSGARAKENMKAKAKIISTESAALNQFNTDVLFSNVIRCIFCGCNKPQSEASTIDEDQMPEDLDTDITKFRRFRKYWKCNCCENKRQFKYPETVPVGLMCEYNEDRVRYFPDKYMDPASVHEVPGDILSKKISIMFPCGMECLTLLPPSPVRKISDIELLLYKGTPFSKKMIETIYMNQIRKYQQKKLYGDQFLGKLQSSESRTLSSVKKLTNEGQIVGSYKWMENRDSELSRMCHQLGQLCVHVEFSIPLESAEVMASILVQKGNVVTATFEGSGNQEQSRTYYVHSGDYFYFYVL